MRRVLCNTVEKQRGTVVMEGNGMAVHCSVEVSQRLASTVSVCFNFQILCSYKLFSMILDLLSNVCIGQWSWTCYKVHLSFNDLTWFSSS